MSKGLLCSLHLASISHFSEGYPSKCAQFFLSSFIPFISGCSLSIAASVPKGLHSLKEAFPTKSPNKPTSKSEVEPSHAVVTKMFPPFLTQFISLSLYFLISITRSLLAVPENTIVLYESISSTNSEKLFASQSKTCLLCFIRNLHNLLASCKPHLVAAQ